MMESLINDLLDLGKLQKNVFKLQEEYFSLPATIYQAFMIVKSTADKKQIELKAVIKNKKHLDLFHTFYGDQRRFMQIFLNFISNALKFTPSGGRIIVKLEAKEHMIIESKQNYERIRKNTLHEFKALTPSEVMAAINDSKLKQDRSNSLLN